MIVTGKNLKTREKILSAPLCPLQISQKMALDRTVASSVTGQVNINQHSRLMRRDSNSGPLHYAPNMMTNREHDPKIFHIKQCVQLAQALNLAHSLSIAQI